MAIHQLPSKQLFICTQGYNGAEMDITALSWHPALAVQASRQRQAHRIAPEVASHFGGLRKSLPIAP